MKTLKMFFVFFFLCCVSISYARWSNTISVKGNGTIAGKAQEVPYQTFSFPTAGYYSGGVSVEVKWQENLLGFYIGDGLASGSVLFYNGTDLVSTTGYVNQEGLGKKTVVMTNKYATSFRVHLSVWVLGWRTASASYVVQ